MSAMSRRSALWFCFFLTATGCAKSAGPASSDPAAPSAPNPPAASTPAAVASAAPVAAKDDGPGTPCGELGCRAFDSVTEAFDVVLAQKPLALGIGEAHAQRGSENVESSTKRFTDTLLPELKGKASFLLVELMLPNDKCKKETKQVKKQQEVVTKPQAETNQNEYVVLGKRAKALGIVPDLLRPSCEDLDRITKAGAGDIGVMLETIANLTQGVVSTELARNEKAHSDRMVVAYGGALHNDLTPRSGREAWSYGPALSERTQKRYIELDLIVPEYIKDTEAWTSLPWYSHYDPEKLGDKTVLFETQKGSYVMVFPRTPAK